MTSDGAGIRTYCLSIWNQARFASDLSLKAWHQGSRSAFSEWRELVSVMAYAAEYPGRRKKTEMNVEQMVKRWVPIIRGLSTAHDKDTLDRCEFEMEQHMGPLLTAPVKQLRQFYADLCVALKSDPTIPMFVWSAFEALHEVVVKKAHDEAVVELKTGLAKEIAEMVEKDIQPDITTAIAGALQWRMPEQLEAIKAAVKTGAKPSLKGKESCLFLCVPDGNGGEHTVML